MINGKQYTSTYVLEEVISVQRPNSEKTLLGDGKVDNE